MPRSPPSRPGRDTAADSTCARERIRCRFPRAARARAFRIAHRAPLRRRSSLACREFAHFPVSGRWVIIAAPLAGSICAGRLGEREIDVFPNSTTRRVVWQLTAAFIDIALHRRGPQDLPASQFLLGLVLIVYAIVGGITLAVISATQADVILLAIELIADLGLVFLLLQFFQKASRFLQTAIALVGTGAMLSLIAIPLLHWDEVLQAPPTVLTTPRFLILVLFLWSLDIGGYIVSKALGKPYIVGVSIVVVYELASMSLLEAFLPATP